MIGKVSGRLGYRGDDHVLIETDSGVGYLVACSDRTLAAMPAPGEWVALYTDLLVREDLMQLIGFPTLAEREWHRLLTTVQGVGAKAALAILGTLGADGVARALSLGDANAIRAAPGVGPKLAQRVILELQAKAPSILAMGAAGATAAMASRPAQEALSERTRASTSVATVAPASGEAQARADALSALVNLGYGAGEAAAAVAGTEAPDAAMMIREALRALAPKG